MEEKLTSMLEEKGNTPLDKLLALGIADKHEDKAISYTLSRDIRPFLEALTQDDLIFMFKKTVIYKKVSEIEVKEEILTRDYIISLFSRMFWSYNLSVKARRNRLAIFLKHTGFYKTEELGRIFNKSNGWLYYAGLFEYKEYRKELTNIAYIYLSEKTQ